MKSQVLDLRGHIPIISGPYTVIPYILRAYIQVVVRTGHVDIAVHILCCRYIEVHGFHIFKACMVRLVTVIQRIRIDPNPPFANTS